MTPIKLLLPTLLLAVTGSSSAAIAPIKKHAFLEVPRGGAGPLDVQTTAKVATAILGAEGAFFALAPEAGLEAYGLKPTPMNAWTAEAIGCSCLATAIASYLLIFKGSSTNTAIGYALWPIGVLNTKSLLSGAPKKLEFSAAGEWLNLAINCFISHALLTNQSYADTTLKVYTVWCLFNGLAMFLSPKPIVEAWGLLNPDDMVQYTFKLFGKTITMTGILVGSLVLGVDSTKAVGYMWGAALIHHLSFMFVTKEPTTFSQPMELMYAGAAIQAVVCATLLL